MTLAMGGTSDLDHFKGFGSAWSNSQEGTLTQIFETLGVANPVILLDEVDKAGIHHTPVANWISEALDPVGNKTYTDAFLGTPYDLSDVLFICTANQEENIPDFLKSRMQMIYVDSYTSEIKVQIAKKYILPQV